MLDHLRPKPGELQCPAVLRQSRCIRGVHEDAGHIYVAPHGLSDEQSWSEGAGMSDAGEPGHERRT